MSLSTPPVSSRISTFDCTAYPISTRRNVCVIKNSPSILSNTFTPGLLSTGAALTRATLGFLFTLVVKILGLLGVYYTGKTIYQHVCKKEERPQPVSSPQPLEASSAVVDGSPSVLSSQVPTQRHVTRTETPRAQIIAPLAFDCSHDKKLKIRELVSKLGTMTYLSLVWNGFELFRLGNSIDDVHPFAFLIVLKEDPECRKYIPQLKESQKWDWLTGSRGLSKTAEREHQKGNLLLHIPAFEAHMGLQYGTVQRFVNPPTIDMTGLAAYLL